MDPETPSQPSQQSSLNQSNNEASKTSAEQATAQDTSQANEPVVDRRRASDNVPSQRSEEDSKATSTSLGYGERGALKERDISESDEQNYSNDGNLEGEQMRAPGEGEVADAVQSKGTNPNSGHAEENSLTGDMDRKAGEHAEKLHSQGKQTGKEMEDEDWTGMKDNVDIAKALGSPKSDETSMVGETERGTGVVLASE